MTVLTALNKLYNPLGPANQQLIATGGTTTGQTTVNIPANQWVVAGMNVYDVTAAANVGTVSAYTLGNPTLTLTANASHAITTGDVLQFGFTPSDVQVGSAFGSDVRGIVEICITKAQEINTLMLFLENDIITSGQDSAANTLLASVVTALA